MPTPSEPLSRRRLLAGAATLTLLGVTAAACGTPQPPPEADELSAQIDRARADSQLATDAAKTVAAAPFAQALTTVAAERSAHAQALTDELTRVLQSQPPTAAPSSTTAAPVTPPTVRDVVGALRQSAESAAGLAADFSGYRAGLLASIAAACTAAAQVALAPPPKETP